MLGKCAILPNTAAAKQVGEDTEQRVYQFEVIMRVPKAPLLKTGDWVHLTKKDGSVDTDAQVRGVVTYNGRFLKLWA